MTPEQIWALNRLDLTENVPNWVMALRRFAAWGTTKYAQQPVAGTSWWATEGRKVCDRKWVN